MYHGEWLLRTYEAGPFAFHPSPLSRIIQGRNLRIIVATPLWFKLPLFSLSHLAYLVLHAQHFVCFRSDQVASPRSSFNNRAVQPPQFLCQGWCLTQLTRDGWMSFFSSHPSHRLGKENKKRTKRSK
jgi:hypothetical protein